MPLKINLRTVYLLAGLTMSVLVTIHVGLLGVGYFLSELPLQNAAGTVGVLALCALWMLITNVAAPSTKSVVTDNAGSGGIFDTVAIKFTSQESRIEKYYMPLLELMLMAAALDLTCCFVNRWDVVEPLATRLVVVQGLLGAGWILLAGEQWRIRRALPSK